MGLRVTRGILVVALLLFVNLQLFILVLRSGDLAATEHQTSQYTIHDITREDSGSNSNQLNLRGDVTSRDSSLASSFIDPSSTEYVTSTVSDFFMNSNWLGGQEVEPDHPDSSSFHQFSGSSMFDVVQDDLPLMVKNLRPKGRWLRQVIGTGKTFEFLSSEKDLLANAFGDQGANSTQQISPKFIQVPSWLNLERERRMKKKKAIPQRQRRSMIGETSHREEHLSNHGGEEEDGEIKSIQEQQNIPCLYSEVTGKNVFLVAASSEEWQSLQRGKVTGPLLVELLNGKTKCPLPIAGQKGMTSTFISSAINSAINLEKMNLGNGNPEVSFIIPMHNHVDLTLRCLLNILRFADEVPSAEYVLVDDGSLEDVEEIRVFLKHMKAAFGVRVKFHRQHLGVGYASIMTQASRLAEGRYLMLLNNDVMMTKGAIRGLYRLFQDYDGVGVAVPLFVQSNGDILDAGGIIFTDASAWQYGRGVPLNSETSHPYEYVRDVDYGTAACLLIPRQLFLDLGMYDAKYAVNKGAYYEDTDMSFHVRAAGYRVMYTPFASVLHYESMSYGDTAKPASNNPANAAAGGGGGAKRELMLRGKATFSSEWGSSLSCTYAHKSVGTQKDAFLPATRFNVLKLLVAVNADAINELLCGIIQKRNQRYSGAFSQGDADYSTGDYGFVRTRSFIEILIAAKVHISVVITGASGATATSTSMCACASELQYHGIHLIPSYKQLVWSRKPTKKECRYDAILINGVATYKHLLLDIRDHCPAAPVVFDTSDLILLKKVKTVAMIQPLIAAPSSSSSTNDPLVAPSSISPGGGLSHEASSRSGGIVKGIGRSLLSRVPEIGAVAGEVQFMLNSAITLVSTQLEKNAVNDQVPGARTMVLSQPVALRPTLASFASRSGLLFAGDLYDRNDVESLLWFLDEILPLVRTNVRSMYKEKLVKKNPDVEYEEYMNIALTAAAYDVVVHVVQLDGRPLPPAHMLPPKLLLLNKSMASSLRIDEENHHSINKINQTVNFIKKDEKKNIKPQPNIIIEEIETRSIIIHDLWPSQHVRTNPPPPEQTMHHKLVYQSSKLALKASMLFTKKKQEVKETDVVNINQHHQNEEERVQEDKGGIEVVVGRVLISLIQFTVKTLWVIVKACFRFVYGTGNSVVSGRPFDWSWITQDVRIWWRQTTKSFRLWWRDSSDNSILAKINMKETLGDGLDDDDDDKFEENNVDNEDSERIGVFKHEGGKRFKGFGAGGWNDDPLHYLDNLFRTSKVGILPLKKTTSSFAQVASFMSRGVPVVATTAAASGSPAFSLDGETPPGDEVNMKEHWNVLVARQEQYLQSIHSDSFLNSTHRKFNDADLIPSPPLLLANDAKNYAKMVARAYTDSMVWSSLVDASYAAVKEHASMAAMVKQTAELVEQLSSTLPTSMSAAASSSQFNNNNNNKKGYNAFSNQINLARNSMAMKPCSSDHINDLLTYAAN